MLHEVSRYRVLCVIFSRFPIRVKIYGYCLYSCPYSLQLRENPLEKNHTYTDTCHAMLTGYQLLIYFFFSKHYAATRTASSFAPPSAYVVVTHVPDRPVQVMVGFFTVFSKCMRSGSKRLLLICYAFLVAVERTRYFRLNLF